MKSLYSSGRADFYHLNEEIGVPFWEKKDVQNARLEKNSHCVISSDNRGSDDDFSEIVKVSLGSLSDNDEDMGQDFEGFKDDDTQFYILIHWGHKASLYN
ncbi:hypothetical protein N7447_008536 [Penicillium robsamsonii]|uniref:uncharacterized protein n=1 Tax=Penicillium robsamsonii TaxID=1792511 RepID=UPI0025494A71|nr:uncharacterized protein N7447_008536 [Penicillium robsamsonii]KAJ5816303.1 hypothetical protein N7447_008536 [Penicillium robsamsonii]